MIHWRNFMQIKKQHTLNIKAERKLQSYKLRIISKNNFEIIFIESVM